MSCTSKQVKIAEEFTWSQRKSNLLFRLRSGRITASKFYDACKTKPTSPSISLVKEICYGTKKFHSEATDWGCKHEKTALQQYAKINIILIKRSYEEMCTCFFIALLLISVHNSIKLLKKKA